MLDRSSQYPGRIRLVPVPGHEGVFDLVRADEPLEEGTPLNKATLLSDDTAESFGLEPKEATPNDAFRAARDRTDRVDNESTVRDINLMLNLSLGTSNIDAWADFLADESRINTAKSSAYLYATGSLKKKIQTLGKFGI